MHSKTVRTSNKVTIQCTVHCIVHLQCTVHCVIHLQCTVQCCTFTVYCTLHCTFTVYSLSLIRTKVRDFDVWARVWGQRKMSQVLGLFGLLEFAMFQPILAWHAFWDLRTISLIFQVFLGCSKLQITETMHTQSVYMGAWLYTLNILSAFSWNIEEGIGTQIVTKKWNTQIYIFLYFPIMLDISVTCWELQWVFTA
jgi:hypothetical protein